jgi:hypothetical protein
LKPHGEFNIGPWVTKYNATFSTSQNAKVLVARASFSHLKFGCHIIASLNLKYTTNY